MMTNNSLSVKHHFGTYSRKESMKKKVPRRGDETKCPAKADRFNDFQEKWLFRVTASARKWD